MIPLIPRPFHAILDYLWGIAVMFAPEMLGFADDKAANTYCKARGGSMVLTSLMTRYELGLVKLIPYNLHLLLDLVSALTLGFLGPRLFGFGKNEKASQAVIAFSAIELGTVLMSKRDKK
ncbi:MAG: hypothetical protein QOH93_631 [Chloroflexia bacterium]|jgi:hypothetical protein|nr:hypothetical protein [Chloroflexia bacterium]